MKITDLVEMNEVKLNMARITWNSLRGNLHEWTPEVANAQPRGELYEIKYYSLLASFSSDVFLFFLHISFATIEATAPAAIPPATALSIASFNSLNFIKE